MLALQPIATGFFVAFLWATGANAGTQNAAELRERAAVLSYNLDHAEAIQLMRQAVAVDPGDSRNHRALASAIWLDILFRSGAVTVDHYLGSFSAANVDLKKPPADLDAEFKREVARAIELAEIKSAASPRNAEALHELGDAVGLQASYVASVEGRVLAGFRAARRSYDAEERAMTLDPSLKDAGLVVGTYRYLVSTLSLPLRLMAYVAGFGGSKEKGLQLIEETAASGRDNRTDAEFALVLLYNRERRFGDAMRVLSDLRTRYPRNRLVLLEAGATATRANRPAEAEALLTEGLTRLAKDNRPKIPGEEALWHYKRGAARVMLRRQAEALADLRRAIEPDAAGWVQGRGQLEMARLALQRNDRQAADRAAAQAIDLCGRNHDPICVDEAKNIR